MRSSAPKPPHLKPSGSRDNTGTARSVAELRTKPRFVRMTGAGALESRVHHLGIGDTQLPRWRPLAGARMPCGGQGATGGGQP
mgnify:CR=1 FL=1